MKGRSEAMKKSKWSNIFNISDNDFLRIFLPMLDDEDQRSLEEDEFIWESEVDEDEDFY